MCRQKHPDQRPWAIRRWPALLLFTAACGGGSDGVASYTLQVVSGNNQTADAGTELPADLVVSWLDDDGQPGPPVTVQWTTEEGGGTLANASTTTDASTGRASNRWTLPPKIEDPWTVTVTGIDSGQVTFVARPTVLPHPESEITFVLDGLPNPGTTVTVAGPFTRPRSAGMTTDPRGATVITIPVELDEQVTVSASKGTRTDSQTCTVGRRMIPTTGEPDFGAGLAIVSSEGGNLDLVTVLCAANWVETGPP